MWGFDDDRECECSHCSYNKNNENLHSMETYKTFKDATTAMAQLQDFETHMQALADEADHPILMGLEVDGQRLTKWVYPTASFQQWTIINGEPVRFVH